MIVVMSTEHDTESPAFTAGLRRFETFFAGDARRYLLRAIDLALEEDGPDLTSRALFRDEQLSAAIVAKEPCVLAGLPVARLVLERTAALEAVPEAATGPWRMTREAAEGARLAVGETVCLLEGPALLLLKAERVILNFICHMSGVATHTARWIAALEGSRTRLLDTRKTLPGLRYPEKYAVLVGGGLNHRKNLAELCMLKDNHIDRAGGLAPAVAALRATYAPCPPIEAECRDLDEVREAVAAAVERIMLDNMDPATMREALAMIPDAIETEISGGVSLERLPALGRLGADFISVGRLTHSAPYADLSMRLHNPGEAS